MHGAVKKLGQNFLRDHSAVSKMVDNLDLQPTDLILEIGPGPGVFTREIIKRLTLQNSFIAVDVDERFVTDLTYQYKDHPNVKIVLDNILKYLPLYKYEGNLKILGSLPYYITSPILHAICKMEDRPQIVVLMVQKEVAQKINDLSPRANYLSTFIQTFFDCKVLGKVPRGSFVPVPKVDSAMLKLTKKESDISFPQIEDYENFLHACFKFPKKMLNKVMGKSLLENVGINPSLRPHDLTIGAWLKLWNEFLRSQ